MKQGYNSVTLSTYYDEIYEVIESSQDSDYKMRMLGSQIMQGASLEFWVGDVCRNIGVDEIAWREEHSLKQQGKVIAQYQLSNELEFVNRHLAEMHQRQKNLGIRGKSLTNADTENALIQKPVRGD